MDTVKRSWKKVPHHIRKPVVLVIGMAFVIAAPLTGWLPGPGGIPLFLIGVAILATEFEWAERLRDYVLGQIKLLANWYRTHKILGTILFIIAIILAASASYILYNYIY